MHEGFQRNFTCPATSHSDATRHPALFSAPYFCLCHLRSVALLYHIFSSAPVWIRSLQRSSLTNQPFTGLKKAQLKNARKNKTWQLQFSTADLGLLGPSTVSSLPLWEGQALFQPSCFLLPPKNSTTFRFRTDIFKNRGLSGKYLQLPGFAYSQGGDTSPCSRCAVSNCLPALVVWLPSSSWGCRHQARVSCHLSCACWAPNPDEGHFRHKGSSLSNTGSADVPLQVQAGKGGSWSFSLGGCLGNGSSGCCGKLSAELSSRHTWGSPPGNSSVIQHLQESRSHMQDPKSWVCLRKSDTKWSHGGMKDAKAIQLFEACWKGLHAGK